MFREVFLLLQLRAWSNRDHEVQAGLVPTFLIPCSSFEATNPTDPGSRRNFLSLTVSSIVPSRMSHISEWG